MKEFNFGHNLKIVVPKLRDFKTNGPKTGVSGCHWCLGVVEVLVFLASRSFFHYRFIIVKSFLASMLKKHFVQKPQPSNCKDKALGKR